MTLSPIWLSRGVPADEIWPNVGLPTTVLGLPNAGVFVALNDSRRSCALTRSVIWNALCAAKSKLNNPGPRSTLRPALPYVYFAFATNAAMLNHSCTVGSDRCQSPTTLGRPAPLPVLEGFPFTVRFRGIP